MLADGTMTEPSALGALLSSYLTSEIEVEVSAIDSSAGTIEMYLTDSSTGTASAFSGDFSGDPAFSTGPVDFEGDFGGTTVTYESVTWAGNLASDGSEITDGVFAGLLNSGPLSTELLGSSDPEAFCDLVRSLGVRCEACADGSTICVAFTVEDLNPVP